METINLLHFDLYRFEDKYSVLRLFLFLGNEIEWYILILRKRELFSSIMIVAIYFKCSKKYITTCFRSCCLNWPIIKSIIPLCSIYNNLKIIQLILLAHYQIGAIRIVYCWKIFITVRLNLIFKYDPAQGFFVRNPSLRR